MSQAPVPAPPADALPGSPGTWATLAPLLGILALGAFAYANSLHGAFAFDDRIEIRDNVAIRDLGTFLGPAGYRAYPNRFVGYATFALNYRLGGLDPFGYHLVNLAIHLLASLLVYRLVRQILRTPRVRASSLASSPGAIAFVAAALFATHPLGTQAVTYIVQRLTSLTALLYLLTVSLYLAWRLADAPGRGSTLRRGLLLASMLLSALLAVRTKEIAFTLPATLVLIEWLLFPPGGVRRWIGIAPVALVALLIPLSWVDLGGTATQVAASADRVTRLLTSVSRVDYLRTQSVVLCEYLRLLAWPSGQNIDHDIPIYTSTLAPRVLLSLTVLAGLAGLAVWAAWGTGRSSGRRLDPAWRVVALGIGWFFVTLAVESSVIPIVDVIYEHRAYLPSVGVFMGVAVLVGRGFQKAAPAAAPRLTVLTGIALSLLLGSITLQRNAVWADPVSLWSDAVGKSPNKARPHQNLGESFDAMGRLDEAEREFRRAVEIQPGSITARTSLATVLQKSGRLGEAEAEYVAALDLDPGHVPAIFNLADILWRSGRREEAATLYRRLLEVGPRSGAARSIAAARAGTGEPPPDPAPPPPR